MFCQSKWIEESGLGLEEVELEITPEVDHYEELAKIALSQEDEGPQVFAKPFSTSIDCASKGTWENLGQGNLRWRQRIRSKGAHSINLGFDNFRLPPSGRLLLYNPSKTYVVGPISQADNDEHNSWWSPIIPFDEVIVEVLVHERDLKELSVEVTSVNHDFTGFGAVLSGSCNVDVLCSAEDGFPLIDRYRDVINSVGMYSIEGFQLCTGALINNARNDCTPYFLTAEHCEVTPANAATVVVYWNYQNSTCRTPGSSESGLSGNGPLDQFNSGAQVLASYAVTDFSLLLLDDDVDPEYNPYFAGWDVAGVEFDSTFCVHHPNTEEKRISFDFDPAVVFQNTFFVRVEDWEFGTTEGGSSGSPLFSKEGRIIAQLSGGQAACGNDLFDDFGSLQLSWEGGGTPATRLKDWLDPDKTGAQILDGRSCRNTLSLSAPFIEICTRENTRDSIIINIGAGFENGVFLRVSEGPEDVDIDLDRRLIGVEESAVLYLDFTNYQSSEDFSLVISGEDSLSSTETEIFILVENDIAPIPLQISPENTTNEALTSVDFSWEGSASSYIFEMSQDSSFSTSAIFSTTTTEPFLRLTDLQTETRFYWRVRALNICGQSAYSSVWSFETAAISCRSVVSDHKPLQIPETIGRITSTIVNPFDGIISDINVWNVRGTHTWINDLTFILTNPSGQSVVLLSNQCDDEDDFQISFGPIDHISA